MVMFDDAKAAWETLRELNRNDPDFSKHGDHAGKCTFCDRKRALDAYFSQQPGAELAELQSWKARAIVWMKREMGMPNPDDDMNDWQGKLNAMHEKAVKYEQLSGIVRRFRERILAEANWTLAVNEFITELDEAGLLGDPAYGETTTGAGEK